MKDNSTQHSIKIFPVGETAVTLSYIGEVSLAVQQKIWWLAKQCQKYELLETIPGMNNLTLIFDPLKFDSQMFIELLEKLWRRVEEMDLSAHTPDRKTVEIPVNYGGQFGPDLLEVAQWHRISPEEVIRRHSDAIYTVFFLGFMPGFVYLGGLVPDLATPRRAEPRLVIPAGSVGIGGTQTGIYPSSSPGGWQIIGNTEVKLFDPLRKQSSLFLPGDRLKFTINRVIL